MNTCTVFVCGDSGVGKTRLIRQFLNHDREDVYDARYSYSAKYSKITNVNNSPMRFLIEETNHPDDIRDMGPVDVVMLCFNILKPQSLHSLYLNWRRMIPVSAKILLVGCQADLKKHCLTKLVSHNLAISFSRKLEAFMYIETESRISHTSSTAAFELAAKSMDQFSRQSSIMSSSSSLSIPLIRSRNRSCSKSREVSKSINSKEFWNKLRIRSPSESRSQQSQWMLPTNDKENLKVRTNMRSKSCQRFELGNSLISPTPIRRFGQEINKETEKLVKIKCLRLKEDRSREEIEIEVPKSVYVNIEDNNF